VILDEKLSSGEVIVLDGATGTEISRLGGAMDSAAWCAVANKTHPDAVRQVHESYLLAGADVITTNTFATCRHVLAGAGLADETVAINRRAVELAREALDNVAPQRPVAVAGSMSTTFSWALDSVSPDPRFMPTFDQEVANYREVAETLADAGCDFLIMEMMGDVTRAKCATQAAIATGLPVWLGLTCSQQADDSMKGFDLENMPKSFSDDFRGPDSPPFQTILDELLGLGVQVAGIMHSSVEDTTPGLEVLCQSWSGPVMAYPETALFDLIDKSAPASITPAEFAQHCRGWVDNGVQIIGGCCGTTIEHIRAMVDQLPPRLGKQAVH
jgi:methionine synthase I (cobalamin-dependent)